MNKHAFMAIATHTILSVAVEVVGVVVPWRLRGLLGPDSVQIQLPVDNGSVFHELMLRLRQLVLKRTDFASGILAVFRIRPLFVDLQDCSASESR